MVNGHPQHFCRLPVCSRTNGFAFSFCASAFLKGVRGKLFSCEKSFPRILFSKLTNEKADLVHKSAFFVGFFVIKRPS